MRIHPMSFVLGLGVAALTPVISRVLRPLAIEAAAAGMGLFDEGRRFFAEQLELLEDLAAEARVRREQVLRAQSGGNGSAPIPEPAAPVGRRRRRNGAPTNTDLA